MLKKKELIEKTVVLDNLEIGGYSDALQHVLTVICLNGGKITNMEVMKASKADDDNGKYAAVRLYFNCHIQKYGYIVREINNFEYTTWKHFKNVKLES